MNHRDTQSLHQEFQSQGYVILPGFLSGQELEDLQSHLDRFIRDVIPTMPSENVFYEDKRRPETLKQFSDMHCHDPYFAELLTGNRFRQVAETLLADGVIAKNLQYFNKPPVASRPTPAHQDGYYFILDPCEAVTMWLALGTVDEENGCVRYVRGSHRRGMRAHERTQVLGFSQGISDYGRAEDLANEVAIPAQSGDLLIHHAMTIHRADGNRSDTRSRRSLGLVYFAQQSREDMVRSREYQDQLNSELAAAGRI